MNRKRFCWFEEREGHKVLCIASRFPERGLYTNAEPSEVVVLSRRMRRALRGDLAGRFIDAMELVSDEQLPLVLDLVRNDFVVSR